MFPAEAMQRVSDAIQSNENSPENSSTGDPTPSQMQDDAVEEETPPPNAPVQRNRSVLRQPSLDGKYWPRKKCFFLCDIRKVQYPRGHWMEGAGVVKSNLNSIFKIAWQCWQYRLFCHKVGRR